MRYQVWADVEGRIYEWWFDEYDAALKCAIRVNTPPTHIEIHDFAFTPTKRIWNKNAFV